MMLAPSTRIGSYEIASHLGSGGMGEVYRARDTKLGRDVAIKILPASVSSDPERLARFEREARLLASLNHPNIAAIHGLEEHEGLGAYIVMELVEGETLAARLLRAGNRDPGLGTRESLAFARQLCDALDAAHERGIVHRDLKPANVIVTPDGTVKVLDFGLAKTEAGPAGTAGWAGGDNLTHSPTVIAPTMDGVLLGTAPYMSPEQARGKAVDKRTDIWAFGCVVYEMLSGRRAFAGETTSDTIVAILEREPDWARLPASTPVSVVRILQRCLDKDPKRRLRDIADGRSELDQAFAGGAGDQDAPIRGRTRGRDAVLALAGILLGIAAASVVAAGLMRLGRTPTAPEPSRIVRVTNGPAREVAPVVSPDGKWIAYLSDAGGDTNVWVKFVSGGEPVNLTAASGLQIGSGTGISGVEVAPDGTKLAVAARPRGSRGAFATWEIPAPLPGAPHKLLEDNSLGARWSVDGKRLAFIRAGASAGDALFVADADGSNAREIIAAQNGMHIHWPAWARDGFIYFIRTFTTIVNLDAAEIYRIDSRGNAAMEPVVRTIRRALFPLPMPAGDGLIYAANPFTAELRLWWAPLRGGAARQITTGVGEYAEPRASADGRTVACTLYELRQSLTRIEVNPSAPAVSAITDGYQGDLDPVVSPGGDRLIFSSSRDGNRHLWIARIDGSGARPLTSGASLDDRPAWSPDGQRVAFVSDAGGTRAIWVMSSDGGPRRKLVDANSTGGLTWSRDGSRIVYAAGIGNGPGLWMISADGGAPERIATPFFAGEPAWSPTKDVIAYMSVKLGTGPSFSTVAFVDPKGHPVLEQVPPAPGGNGFSNGMLAWSPDGRRLAVAQQQANSAAQIWILDPEASPLYTKLIDFSDGPRIRGMAWSRDGRGLVIGKHDWTSDIVLIDLTK